MDVKPLFPVALNLQGQCCLVVSSPGDAESRRRVDSLSECGALVRVVEYTGELDEAAFSGIFFVISTVNDASLSSQLRRLSERHGFLLCCIDQPQYGCVAMTAIAACGPVRVGVSTSGTAPAISKAVKRGLQQAMNERFHRFVDEIAEIRREVRRRMPRPSQMRQRFSANRAAADEFEVRVEFRYPQWFKTD